MSSVWYPGPRYLLRKYCLLRMLRGMAGGRVLEIGCAQGDMLRTLAERGFTGLGVDISEEAVRLARTTLAGLEDRVRAALAGAETQTGPYDYVMAFEVLEHIRDDGGALGRWRSMLRPGGYLFLSVPAHPGLWGPTDVRVGHYRRYERAGLVRLLRRTGFEVERLWCYGFPAANISQAVANWLERRRKAPVADESREARSARSGVGGDWLAPLQWLYRNPLLAAGQWLQLFFVDTHWGNGYILRARRV